MLLQETDAVATLAVKDLGAAARFYETTLGLSRASAEDGEAITFEIKVAWFKDPDGNILSVVNR